MPSMRKSARFHLSPGASLTRVGVIALAILCAGCGGADDTDAPQGESDALTCGDSETCAPGLCIDAVCLDASADDDGDGLSNGVEAELGTDPLNLDSDGDTLIDSFEVALVDNPTDTDGDGVIDALESDKADADCDNISDQDDPTYDRSADVDRDGNGEPDTCLLDRDSDGIPDIEDCEPTDPSVGDSCPDASFCFVNVCQPGVGCTSEPMACDDDNSCTVDSCNQSTGECVFGLVACDDDPCTDDVCDPATGACLTAPKDCEDDIPCTTDEHCESGTGVCVSTPKDCEDGDPCTVDVCLPNSGLCQATDLVCDDLDACTIDVCDPFNGECLFQGGKCDDGSTCTIDSCDPFTGECTYETILCDDDDACTIDLCDPETGECTHEAKFCDDDSLCTETVCDPETGWCDHPPVVCNDFDACTSDSCDLETGECVNAPISCVDILQCTEDTCVPSVGCVFVPVPCDDGDPCTEGSCSEDDGACSYVPVQCDDEDPCTVDTCNADLGGSCSYIPVACDDGDPCTADSCDPDTGACESTPIPAASLLFAGAQDGMSGVALWNSDGTGSEPENSGHTLEVCGGVQTPYYLASADYAGIDPGVLGATQVAEATGLAAFEAHLATLDMSLSDLTLKLAMSDLGDDEEGNDWSFDSVSLIEQRLYRGVSIEVWLGDKPLCTSTLSVLTAEADYSVCEPAPRPLSFESSWAYAVDLTTEANVSPAIQLAAQLLLQSLGVPAKIQLELELTMEDVEALQSDGREGVITRNVVGALRGQDCSPSD